MAFRIVVIGGGYTGAATAIQFSKNATRPTEISVIEPRADIGLGTAYATDDPVLRLNVEDSLMVVRLDAIGDFPRWLKESKVRSDDPAGENGQGEFYARRKDFGKYMQAAFRQAIAEAPAEITLGQCRARALDIRETQNELRVVLDSGADLSADLVVLAIGNDRPADLTALPETARAHSAYVADPWAEGALASVHADSRVLVVGTGLTAVDVIASLSHCGHKGQMTAISRRGLLPRVQGQFPGIQELLRRNALPEPIFIQEHGQPETVLQILRWVRQDIAAAAARAEPWHDAVDAVRDAAKVLWPKLSLQERRRFFRHLKPFYDSHRFRIAPQINKIIQDRRAAGNLSVHAARIVDCCVVGDQLRVSTKGRQQTQIEHDDYDLVVNCTGPNADPANSGVQLFRTAVAAGVLASDPTGVGLAVNDRCETLRANGMANARILTLGPMSRGQFAEVMAVPQITLQLAVLTGRLASEGIL